MEDKLTSTRDLVIRLKEVFVSSGMKQSELIAIMEKNGDYVVKSTVSRFLKDGSEDEDFSYTRTIQPIARALLGMETIEDDDSKDIQAMKSLVQYKKHVIIDLEEELEAQKQKLVEEKEKFHAKLEKEREQFQRSLDFLKKQIEFKDKRIDTLLDFVSKRDEQNQMLLDRMMMCPNYKRKECE